MTMKVCLAEEQDKADTPVKFVPVQLLQERKAEIHNMIAQRAYELFEYRGRVPSHEMIYASGGGDVRLATMAAPPREFVGAQDLFSHAPVDGGWSRSIYHRNEHFRQHNCLPQRTGQDVLGLHRRVARGLSREPFIRKDRPFRKRHRLGLFDVAVFDGSDHMVARNQQLASQLDCELEIAICALQLGPA